jgi:hypothetical protein
MAAGVSSWGNGQRVAHVMEILDEAYRNFHAAPDERVLT